MIVIEIQKNNSSPVAIISTTFTDPQAAEQDYHAKLSYAAVSSISAHSVVMLSDTGEREKGETYYHG